MSVRKPISENDQLKFLLSQAPMIDWQPDFPQRSITPYAYVHPKTLASAPAARWEAPGNSYVTFPPFPTKWLLTSLMPEGRVIFSPNVFPGLDK